jgi:hypothetical protein
MSNGENRLHDVAEFRKRLGRAVKDLPRPERDRLLEQINTHLEEAISSTSTAAEVRAVLDALGSPAAIAAAARTTASASAGDPYHGGDRLQLAWVLVGILVVIATSFTTSWVLGLAFQAAFLVVAVVLTAVGRPREAAPMYLIGACGLHSIIFLIGVGLGPNLLLHWQTLVIYIPFLAGLVIGVLWLWRLRKARLEVVPA